MTKQWEDVLDALNGMDSMVERIDEAVDGAEVWSREPGQDDGTVNRSCKRALAVLDELRPALKDLRLFVGLEILRLGEQALEEIASGTYRAQGDWDESAKQLQQAADALRAKHGLLRKGGV